MEYDNIKFVVIAYFIVAVKCCGHLPSKARHLHNITLINKPYNAYITSISLKLT